MDCMLLGGRSGELSVVRGAVWSALSARVPEIGNRPAGAGEAAGDLPGSSG